MKKILKISLCLFAALSMFCGCKADGSLDDEKLSGLVNSGNGNNEEKNESTASDEKTGINCLSAYNSTSGNGIQLMFSNLPDGCNGADIIYKSQEDEYWQTTAYIDLSGNNRTVYFPFVDDGKKYSFYANLNHNETGKESVRLGYSSVVEIVAKGENLLGEIKILENPYIEKIYENGILKFDKISVKNPDCLGDVVCEVFDEWWGWQRAYKGEFADGSVSFDFSDENLKFWDNRDFSYDKNGRYNLNVYFLTNQGGETVRLFFYHTVYNSEPEYGKKGANDYYTYK